MYKVRMIPILDTRFTFLLHCSQISYNETNKEELLHFINTIQDFESIIRYASKHAVFPHVAEVLIKFHSMKVPFIKKHYTQLTQHNMQISITLIALLKHLKKHHIQTLSFKGVTLAKSAYGNISLRQFSDIDILIHEHDKLLMYHIMLSKGYIPQIKLKSKTKKTFFDAVNVLGFYHPKSKIFIEVHWELLSKNYAIKWKENSLWKDISNITIFDTSIDTLNIESELLYLSLHGCKHLYERLGWVCDIDRVLRSNPSLNWHILLQQAHILGATRMLLLSCSISHMLLDTPLPSDIHDKITQDCMIKKLTEGIITLQFSENKNKNKKYKHFLFLWQMRETTTDKFHFALNAIFSPKFDDFKFIQLPYYLVFLYPFIRLLRLFIKYLK